MSIEVKVRDKGRDSLSLYYVCPFTKREKSKAAGTRDLIEAQIKARTWAQEILKKRGEDDTGWDWFLDRFRDEALAGKKGKTRRAYLNALGHYGRVMDPASVREVTTEKVGLFTAALINEEYPLSTVGQILRHCRRAFRWANRVGMLPAAPYIEMPKAKRRFLGRGRGVTEKEYKTLLRHADAPYGADVAGTWRRFLDLLWFSGLRIGEAVVLSWDQPPFRVMLDAKPYPHIAIYGEGQKSGHDEIMPIAPDFADWLAKTRRKDRHGLVAPVLGIKGEPLISDAVISRGVGAIGTRAKIVVNDKGKFATAQDFRRGFGERWAMRVLPQVLQRMMRHDDIKTTLTFYVRLEADAISEQLWKWTQNEKDASRKMSRKPVPTCPHCGKQL